MSSRIPVIAIHGVNNREKAPFQASVDALQAGLDRLGKDWKLWSVFWGDLAAGDEYLDRTLGKAADELQDLDFATHEAAGPATFLECITDKDAGAHPVLRTTVERAWTDLVAIPHVEGELCDAIAAAYVDALSAAAPPFDDEQFARAALIGIDRMVAEALRRLRRWAMPNIFRFAGDIAVYTSHARQPAAPGVQRIQDRVIAKLDEIRATHGEDWGTSKKPISVVAHSLGALVVFDLANQGEIDFAVETMVSFGTQVSAIHLLEPRPTLPKFEGADKIEVSRTNIGHWVNLWHPIDWLAFVMTGVFNPGGAHDPELTRIVDVQLPIDGNLDVKNVHSSYWTSRRAADRIYSALRVGEIS